MFGNYYILSFKSEVGNFQETEHKHEKIPAYIEVHNCKTILILHNIWLSSWSLPPPSLEASGIV